MATKWRDAALPCDPDRLAALVDRDAFRARFAERAPDYGGAPIGIAESLTQTSLVATKVCAWLSRADHYTLLRLREVDGHLRAVLRRSTGATASYHELELTRSPDDQQVRVADVYSYFKGEWISDELASEAIAASSTGTEIATVAKLQQATMLQDSEPAQALAALDELPPRMRALRSIQGWRVTLAQHISVDAYRQALDELLLRFPHDASVALLEIDGAYLRGDIAGALRFIDTVDAAIGPDPFLDGTRAMMLAARDGPGDLDQAAAKAEHAAHAEPDLAIGSWARIAVALARHHWTDALDQIDDLSARFGVHLDDAALRSGPMFAALLATPEYAAWRAQHP